MPQGEPMPQGEQMFKYHGYSGPCPKPPIPRTHNENYVAWAKYDNGTIKLCDSDSSRAFPVYKEHEIERLKRELADKQEELDCAGHKFQVVAAELDGVRAELAARDAELKVLRELRKAEKL